MAAINELRLAGKIIQEPTIRYVGEDMNPLFHCILSVKRPGVENVKDEDKKYDFIHIVNWNNAEEYKEKYKKYDNVYIKGRFQSRNREQSNNPKDEEYNELLQLASMLNIEDKTEFVQRVLECLHLDGRVTSHIDYDVSAISIEPLSDKDNLNENFIILLGKIVREPTFKYIKNNYGELNPLWKGYIAINRPHSQHLEDEDKRADYINIIDWGKEAEICNEHTQNGSQIAVVGRIQSRNYYRKKEPKPEQYNELAEYVSTLSIDDHEKVIKEILKVLNLDSQKEEGVTYEVSASHVEFLNNCVFE